MEQETARILKIRLEGISLDVETAASSLKSVLEIVEESRSYANADGKKVRRYLVALVKRGLGEQAGAVRCAGGRP